MSLAVDKPILNNPFEEPREYWIYEEGQPKRMSGRRPVEANGSGLKIDIYNKCRSTEVD